MVDNSRLQSIVVGEIKVPEAAGHTHVLNELTYAIAQTALLHSVQGPAHEMVGLPMITNPLRKNSSWACLHYGPTRLRKSLRRSLPRWFHTLSNQTEPSQKVREILYERPNRYVGDEKMDNPPCHLLSNSPRSLIKIFTSSLGYT